MYLTVDSLSIDRHLIVVQSSVDRRVTVGRPSGDRREETETNEGAKVVQKNGMCKEKGKICMNFEEKMKENGIKSKGNGIKIKENVKKRRIVSV